MSRDSGSFPIILILTLLLLVIFDSVWSSCQKKCGGIEILYPFGIGVDCYLDKWYEIECVNDKTALLSAVSREVVHISLPLIGESVYSPFDSYGSVRIKNRITSKGCSSNEKEEATTTSLLDLTGSPFYVTDKNTLVAVGCNITASLTNVEPSLVKCSSSCGTKNPSHSHSHTRTQDYLAFVSCQIKRAHNLQRDYFTEGCAPTRNNKNETICNGIGCCQTSIPNELQQVVGVRIEENTTTSRGGCKVAFLTDEAYSFKHPKNLYAKGHATIELGWFFLTRNVSFISSLECDQMADLSFVDGPKGNGSCACYSSADSSYASCACLDGYRGNPYTLNGCKDIDECLEKNTTRGSVPCWRYPGYTCVNRLGDYHCFHKKTKPIALGVGVSFGSLIFMGGVYWLYRYIKIWRKINRKKKYFKRNGGLLLQQQMASTEGNVEKTKVFSSKELEKATENFNTNRVLGQGGQGTVYKGMLANGGIVAVKKSKVVDEDRLEEFINEVVILSQINHRNIVKLLGCCLETEVPVLVYEFIPNGNLFEYLHEEFDANIMAAWEMRLHIAVDVAGALSYLHSAASSPIYHRDIKSTNIMLDEKYRAKVSDFGTSRSVTVDQTHLTTVVLGTAGYVDPEYFQSSQFTDKSDVYSFGVVLVELITGAKAISFMRSQENRTLATYFILTMKENKLEEIIDARIREGCKLAQVTAVAKLARKCLNLKGRKRPSMRQVSMELESIRSSHGDPHPNVHVTQSDEDEEEETVEVNIGVESWNNVAVTENVATSFLDAEPLFPRQTW